MDAEVLRSKLVAPNGPYAAIDVVGSTGSTNADLVLAADSGALDRTVLIAEEQTAGRGRHARTWASPAGAGLYLSVLLITGDDVPFTRLGTLSLLAGVAVARTAEQAGVNATLKWPNDVLVEDQKLAGILSEVAQSKGVVVGIGLNVTALPESVPAGAGGLRPTSLAEQGASVTDREELAGTLLSIFAELEQAWRETGGNIEASGLLEQYRRRCATLGSQVRVELPDGSALIGVATDVDQAGQLAVTTEAGALTTVAAGDVIHLRTQR